MRNERGFTLVEALAAIVVFAVGIMAVSNLMLVAASSNKAANYSSAATAAAVERLDILKSTTYENLVAGEGGSVTADVGATAACLPDFDPATAVYNCTDNIPGVGTIHVRWAVEGMLPGLDGQPTAMRLTAFAEGTGPLTGPRTRAQFTTLRSCTNYQADRFPATCPVQ